MAAWRWARSSSVFDLAGKTALIVGVASPLMGEICLRLATAGAKLILQAPIHGSHVHKLAELAIGEGYTAEVVRINLARLDGLDEQIGNLDPFDIAVVQTSNWEQKPFIETSSKDWERILACNFEQAVFASQAIARRMIAHKTKGRIIFLSSVAALKPFENRSVHGTSLAALHTVARMAAVDLGTYDITVNVVAEGFIKTWQDVDYLGDEPWNRVNIPLQRLGTMHEIGAAICFLASDEASYITGAIIPVDGGYTLTKAGAATTRKDDNS
jgi:NAD(P)-dependent dehydrogenase (short-subunit alcohol dehydrogenase family)